MVVHAVLLVKIGGAYQANHDKANNSFSKITIVSKQVADTAKKKPLKKTVPRKKIVKKKKTDKPAEKKLAEVKPPEPEQQPQPTPSVAAQTDVLTIIQQKQTYLKEVLGLIEKNKTYPYAARRRGLKGEIVVALQLNANGEITGINCIEGHPILCQAALASTRAAQPYGPLPDGVKTLSFEYIVNYQLK